ncbi:Planctomycete cytochrome C [Planctomycetes bacterium Pan216]|uniref:Planctomycete cytochrome C n=1 Tax=Kolteria novifilia TaxID=2527975 RepID=A0A518B8N2_9BACT|nr:Planctomycete cytochrome C [Planctomycetes bacterium Pan216]
MPAINVLFVVSALLLPSVAGADPVARWDFGTEESTPLTPRGNVQRDQAGPRPPEFPNMASSNTAVRLDAGAYLSVPDTGPDSDLDFTNGDAITIEAWVNPTSIREGQPRYIIGKGRTGSPKFARDNQNWALRIVGSGGEATLSFLFATKLTSNGKHWHRWDTKKGFPVNTGWHHIAVSYRFGDPKSIRGWINGKPMAGTWSYAGPTKEAPVVDDDEVRIGNGFEGLLDAVAIHRNVFDDKKAASRFQRVGKPRVLKPQPEVMPELSSIPEGRVLVQLCAGLPAHKRWLNEGERWPKESARVLLDSFLLPRIPLQFDSWGIRAAWSAPVLLRIAGDVELSPGKHRFMMRAREMGRLWVDGQLVARTKPMTKRPPDGEEPIIPVAEPPLPGLRAHGYNQQETFGEVTIEPAEGGGPRRCRVVLELVVGGNSHRTETGEICVALQTPDGKSYDVLGSGSTRLPLTDSVVEPALEEIEKKLVAFDDQRRRQLAASEDGFWRNRHDLARKWSQKRPMSAESEPKQSQIDALVASKIEQAIAASTSSDVAETKFFHGEILPILREQCFRCHGEKDKGGLKLDSREAALKAGDSEVPAVVPGDLDASELIVRVQAGDMPPTEEGLPADQIKLLEEWVTKGAPWPAPPLVESEVALAPVIGDEAFVRRIYLDLVGVPPTAEQTRAFLADTASDKRDRLIDTLLDDDRFADRWMSFWLDLLAENPSLLNASLNSTGPFRWFLYDSLRDNKSLDRMVTELIMMRGGAAEGGSAGFGLAGENDAPLAAKGHIVASAFLGIELECARCHDSPYHSTTQEDLYSLAAMFNRRAVTVPKTSRVPASFFENQRVRESLIQVTLKPDQPVTPQWPFAAATGVADDKEIDRLMRKPSDTRERLAALITAPRNKRFSRVIVNRVWKALIGAGLVEPVHDWEGNAASHPELLRWLAEELVTHDYDFRHLVRLIVSSDLYQREANGKNLAASAQMRFFNAPERRRLSAEQIVDSLHEVTGNPIDAEELTFVHDGRRPLGSRQTLGRPTRAWMFGDLKNERDRPSLSLPKARAVVDVLEAFGWTGARQMPIHQREADPNVLQPGVLANGTLSVALTRASHQSELAELAVNAQSSETLVQTLFLRILNRLPKPDEREVFVASLKEGFDERLVPADEIASIQPPPKLPQVTWFNHLRSKANEIQLEIERRVQDGPPADPRLQPSWRSAYEDAVWSLINHREFVWMP